MDGILYAERAERDTATQTTSTTNNAATLGTHFCCVLALPSFGSTMRYISYHLEEEEEQTG